MQNHGSGKFAAVETHVQVEQFYARQMRLLDSSAAETWADTFTEDAVFEEKGKSEPVRGRSAIAVSARARADQVAGDGLTRRHWLGMLDVVPENDGLRTYYYALAMATPLGGELSIYVSANCIDFLVLHGGKMFVQHRSVRHDAT